MALPRSYIFLLCSVLARGASWIRKLIWFFKKGPRWTRVITTSNGLGSRNLPLFWGAWFRVTCLFTQLPCVVMGKYTLYTQGMHWIDLTVLPPLLSVKASLIKKAPYPSYPKSPLTSRNKGQKCFIWFCESYFWCSLRDYRLLAGLPEKLVPSRLENLEYLNLEN